MDITIQTEYAKAFDREYLDLLKRCGYDGVELLLEGDLSGVERVKENLESAGLYVAQTELTRDNAIEGLKVSAQLGVKWAALSVVINYDTLAIRRLIPIAEEYGVGIALENPATHDDITDTFCIYIDSFNSDFIGMCYNIGRANLAGCDDFGIKKFDVDKISAIKKAGDRIKIIHVNDNHGDVDRKLCPTVANAVCGVKWKDVIEALDETGFDRAFSLVCPIDFGEYDLYGDYLEFIARVSKALLGRGEA